MNAIKTRMYFTGGTGINHGMQYSPNSEAVCFIDSSSANLKRLKISEDRLYLIPGTDGAGGDQSFMMPHARKHVPLMLEKFPPGEFNVVVTSGGGGTGSTITVCLVRELLKARANFIVVVVGNYDVTKRVRNTNNTLKNLEMIALQEENPVVVAYVSNAGGEAAADEEVMYILSAIDALTDQDNDRLDTKDIENFVNYHRVVAVPPQLCTLHIRDNRADAASILEPISVAGLVNDISKDVPYGSAFLRKVGITRHADKIPGDQLHFVINSVGVTDIFDDLDNTLVKLNTVQSGFRQRRASFVPADLGEDNDLFVN